ncbi:DUF4166 domain-containing protein [Ruegeria sp. EL01]|uniref:DUF4166 domain-containing protein n=1 Tax=Ruegeria sp. EL01 TaxID=2107578 RepID=UPI0020B17403|nr:DUF4166 domain-containing protein [Ruegeria sp. EL01]
MSDPFLRALPAEAELPEAVRTLHSSEGRFAGRCWIERGQGRLVAMALRLGRFPPAGSNIPVQVTISRDGQRWSWERDFNDHKTQSSLTYDHDTGCVREDFGAMSIWLQPSFDGRRLGISIHRLTILGVPIPPFLLPRSTTTEWQDEQGCFKFDVAAEAPGLGLLIRYQGWLTPVHSVSG